MTDALGQKETYEYDQYGRLKTKRDRDNYATTYTYNALGVVTNVGYSDGRSVEFSYNELNQLNEINDWLGKTTLENDILGRLTKVTDYQNRTVSYEYNEIGAKTKLTYPDGRTADYTYDGEGRLSGITGNGEKTSYSYDELGRLTEKILPNGVKQAYTYFPGGNLKGMESLDKAGELDKYFYTYDNAGRISGINRKRRGLDAVSGQFDYKYDAIGRLTESRLNGQVKSAYEYDAFGNRISLTENETKTSYTYDVLDRLVEAKELNNSQAIIKTYDYDKRGNQTKEFIDGLLQKTFIFDATNMLIKVTDATKGELENQYNGLGFRVASTRPEEKIEYLCDLSRDYHNLLERTVNGETESFIYDNNVISMSKAGSNYYYLQDELGSTMYLTGTDGVTVSSYAFDDFGRNIDPRTGKQRKHDYTINGNIIQPFVFTGYQEDEVSSLKFAQARFYDPNTGRFQSEDIVKGFMDNPFALNRYGYCWNKPHDLVDLDGNWPKWVSKATDWCKDNKKNLIKIGIGVGVATIGVVATVATGGAALPAVVAAGEAMLTAGAASAAISGGITTAKLAIDGNLDSEHVSEIANSAWDGFADGVMAGGIMSGLSQLSSVGMKLAAQSNILKTGRKGGIEIAKNMKILSPDSLRYANSTPGGTLIKFGNKFRIDVRTGDAKNILLGAGQLLHAHIGISEATHIPLGLLITSIFPGINNGIKDRDKEIDEEKDEAEENCDE